MKIGVISLGCAKNLVDTENLLGVLKAGNQEIVQSFDDAEVIIVNTCGFIEPAKVEAIDTIFDVAELKENNLKKLVVMGCLAQRYKAQLEEEMPEVDRFISIDEYKNLGRILSEVIGEPIPNTYGKSPRVLSGKPWMGYLRIADGCDNRCAYCAIPLIRGDLRSTPEDELVEEATRLVQSGVKELNLIAQDSSRYGYDWDKKLHLSHLLKRLDEIEGVHWIRILYLYPDEIPDDLIETIKNSKHVLPYFDIPTQHGADHMIEAMHRRGSRKEIFDRCQKIRSEFKHPVLRTTLISGFPGETLKDHEDSLSLLTKIHWDHLGVFTYSKEEDTPSFELEDDVPEEEKERRRKELMETQMALASKDREEMVGMVEEVLIESFDPLTSMYVGRSPFYAPDGVDGCVRFKSDKAHDLGDFAQVLYTRASGQNMIGKEVDEDENNE